MKRLKRIQKIYEMRVEIARREAGAAQQARLTLEDVHTRMGETLTHELDTCDSIERAPFDFAARYYRATVDRMHVKQGEIAAAAKDEIAASDVLRQRYQEQKEFDVFVSRRQGEHDMRSRQKENEKAREYYSVGPGDFGIADAALDSAEQ